MSVKDDFPRRGQVWWVAFDPSVGGEIQKTRPAVVISNDESNRYLNRVQVVPLSSKTEKIYPGECLVMLNEGQCKAIASQMTTASKRRLSGKLGTLSLADLEILERALKVQLSL